MLPPVREPPPARRPRTPEPGEWEQRATTIGKLVRHAIGVPGSPADRAQKRLVHEHCRRRQARQQQNGTALLASLRALRDFLEPRCGKTRKPGSEGRTAQLCRPYPTGR